MRGIYQNIVWTVIALALSLIALNPWLAPGGLSAQEGAVKVDIVSVNGTHTRGSVPVYVENK